MEIPKEFVPILLVQIALFLALWMVLKRVWFEPALKILAARERRTEGALAEAKVLRAETERLRVEHATALEQAKADARREVHEILRQAEAEQRRLIGDANEAAQQTLTEMRARIATEMATARRELQRDVDAIAREVASTVTGRAV
jgi:F0F1-type ATP synthase membrane subunit b/b'